MNLDKHIEDLMLDRLRIQAHKRAVALRREARQYWHIDKNRYMKLKLMAEQAEEMSRFFAAMKDPDRFEFTATPKEKADGPQT